MSRQKTSTAGIDQDTISLTENEDEQLHRSAECYKSRRKLTASSRRGDWWIALGIYLLITGLALAVL